jgi:folate-binding protein YgfZ
MAEHRREIQNGSDDAGAAFCDLPAYGLLRVSGEDAASFLQGQTTCDVHALAQGAAGIGALCTPKGRVFASFRLLRTEQGFYLLLVAELAAAVCKRLKMYVLRSKVMLEDLTPSFGLLGLIGAGVDAVLADAGLPVPPEPATGRELEDGFVLSVAAGRALVAAAPDALSRFRPWREKQLPGASDNLWRLKEIEAGYPDVAAAISEEFLPQMLNLDILGGIGFKKGCYTGQEIVTRTHYLGQVKRRMFRLTCAHEGIELLPGTPIVAALDADVKNAGQIVTAAAATAVLSEVLAVLGMEYMGSRNLHVGGIDGPKAEWLALPYAIE